MSASEFADIFEGIAPQALADLVESAGSLRALERQTGIGRPTLRRLLAGEGCSLANLARLVAVEPSLVVYVGGFPYRLEPANGAPVAIEGVLALGRDQRGGVEVVFGPTERKAKADGSCDVCEGPIARGETIRATTFREPGVGLRSQRECSSCIRGEINPDAGSERWRSHVGGQI